MPTLAFRLALRGFRNNGIPIALQFQSKYDTCYREVEVHNIQARVVKSSGPPSPSFVNLGQIQTKGRVRRVQSDAAALLALEIPESEAADMAPLVRLDLHVPLAPTPGGILDGLPPDLGVEPRRRGRVEAALVRLVQRDVHGRVRAVRGRRQHRVDGRVEDGEPEWGVGRARRDVVLAVGAVRGVRGERDVGIDVAMGFG